MGMVYPNMKARRGLICSTGRPEAGDNVIPGACNHNLFAAIPVFFNWNVSALPWARPFAVLNQINAVIF
jgi:hypothetical protein